MTLSHATRSCDEVMMIYSFLQNHCQYNDIPYIPLNKHIDYDFIITISE